MKGAARLALITAGLAAAAMLSGATPALADHDEGYARDHIRRDFQDIRRDEARLRRLERRRDQMRRCHNWRALDALDRQIDGLQNHIDSDHSDVRQDFRRARDDNGGYYRAGGYDEYRYSPGFYRNREPFGR
ncbi:MAG TPA: hypothetical protein VGS41_07040 [Chthonomonadales bacterium]|nr:hypothetical protein [Chthonomonadales bacterium]